MSSDVKGFTGTGLDNVGTPPVPSLLSLKDPPIVSRNIARGFSIKRKLMHLGRAFVAPLSWTLQDRLHYFAVFGRLANLHSPSSFNEKLLYRKTIYGDYDAYRRLADKSAVRAYVAESIGERYLIPLLHETDDPASLFELPHWEHTVIKANHGSGMVEVLLSEPDSTRKDEIVKNCGQWLRSDFSRVAREIHYRGIPPKIMVEKYIGDGRTAPIDYKFHMFKQADDSFQYVLQAIYNRLQPPLTAAFFVNNLHAHFPTSRCDKRALLCEKNLLRKALHLSEELVKEFDYARVDWYIHEGRIYFGEITFTPGAGIVTGFDNGLDQLMGKMWVQYRASDSKNLHCRVLAESQNSFQQG